MRVSTKLFAAGASLALLAACSSNPVTDTVKGMKSAVKMDSSVGGAIKAAKAANKKAASLDGEWSTAGKLIKQAEKLAAAGKNDEAIKKANIAVKQGEMGYAQAQTQQNAGPRF